MLLLHAGVAQGDLVGCGPRVQCSQYSIKPADKTSSGCATVAAFLTASTGINVSCHPTYLDVIPTKPADCESLVSVLRTRTGLPFSGCYTFSGYSTFKPLCCTSTSGLGADQCTPALLNLCMTTTTKPTTTPTTTTVAGECAAFRTGPVGGLPVRKAQFFMQRAPFPIRL